MILNFEKYEMLIYHQKQCINTMQKSLYMTILVPVDGSKYSEKALIHACELAKIFKSKIHIIYVVDKSPTFNLLDRGEFLKIMRNFGSKVLKKSVQLAIENGVDPKAVMKEGNIVNEIVKYAKDKKCNLIIVGNKGLGAAARFLLGSVSSKLANNSPCSLLIVK